MLIVQTALKPVKARGEQLKEYKKRSKGLQYLSESELAAFKNALSFRDSCLGYYCHLCLYFVQTPKLRYV